jgi:hypothetical protein
MAHDSFLDKWVAVQLISYWNNRPTIVVRTQKRTWSNSPMMKNINSTLKYEVSG